jgi:hypothetical protein
MTATAHPPAGAQAAHGVRSEDDHVPSLTLVKVGVGALLIFFLGGLAAVSYLRAKQDEAGPAVIPPEIGQSKIGLVEQQQFGLVARGERARATQLKRLGSYGWVDEKAGVAHIPIDLAMRLVAEGVRPAGAGSAAPDGGQP